GVGIEPADLPHIFERFYRADKARTRETGGTGLGLAITREIIARHHGTVDVESTVGKGSSFTIQLPLR
ncbi:MAG TPA: ATP-binding protein, partial [Candidatus Obscuribacter sp.]|nr:ATP-binding protein [Candidatus Obscuribacter sp.]